MKIISTENAPQAIGPYSQAVESGGFLFASGQIPADPQSGELAPANIQAQARQVMENVKALLEAAGYSLTDVVKTTCFLKDLADFATFNSIYAEYFTGCPARSCVAVREIPKGVLCEVEVIAHRA